MNIMKFLLIILLLNISDNILSYTEQFNTNFDDKLKYYSYSKITKKKY